MSKNAKVSVFEIRGEIHYAEDDVDNPINPIKYFCVRFCDLFTYPRLITTIFIMLMMSGFEGKYALLFHQT